MMVITWARMDEHWMRGLSRNKHWHQLVTAVLQHNQGERRSVTMQKKRRRYESLQASGSTPLRAHICWNRFLNSGSLRISFLCLKAKRSRWVLNCSKWVVNCRRQQTRLIDKQTKSVKKRVGRICIHVHCTTLL